MKSLKEFIEERELPEIYLDMDQILYDWYIEADQILEKYRYPKWNDKIWEEYDEYQRDEIRIAIIQKNENFYNDMSLTKDGKKIWKFVSKYKPNIVTSVDERFENCVEHKKDWIKEKLGNNVNEIYFIDENVEKYSLNNRGKSNILISKFIEKCQLFESFSGISLQYIDSKITIKELKKIGF